MEGDVEQQEETVVKEAVTRKGNIVRLYLKKGQPVRAVDENGQTAELKGEVIDRVA